jgi:hypothetical protein
MELTRILLGHQRLHQVQVDTTLVAVEGLLIMLN